MAFALGDQGETLKLEDVPAPSGGAAAAEDRVENKRRRLPGCEGQHRGAMGHDEPESQLERVHQGARRLCYNAGQSVSAAWTTEEFVANQCRHAILSAEAAAEAAVANQRDTMRLEFQAEARETLMRESARLNLVEEHCAGRLGGHSGRAR